MVPLTRILPLSGSNSFNIAISKAVFPLCTTHATHTYTETWYTQRDKYQYPHTCMQQNMHMIVDIVYCTSLYPHIFDARSSMNVPSHRTHNHDQLASNHFKRSIFQHWLRLSTPSQSHVGQGDGGLAFRAMQATLLVLVGI